MYATTMPLPCRSFQAVAVKEERGCSEFHVRAIKQATERESGVERLRACDLQCNLSPQPHWGITTCKLGKVSPQLQPTAHAPTCQCQRAHQTFSQLRYRRTLDAQQSLALGGHMRPQLLRLAHQLVLPPAGIAPGVKCRKVGQEEQTVLPRESFAACTVRVVPTRCPPMQRRCPPNAPISDLAFTGAVCMRG